MSCIGAQAYVCTFKLFLPIPHLPQCLQRVTMLTLRHDIPLKPRTAPPLFPSLSVSPSMSLSLLLNPHWVVCSSQSGTHSLSHHLPPRSQQRHSGSLCCSFICSDLFFAHERLQLPEGSASQLLALKHSLKPKGVSAWMPRMYGCILLSFVSDV